MAKLSTQPVIQRRALEQLGEVRLKEAGILRDAGCFSGAVYLAGYAVECYLKVAVCAVLDWEEMRATFMTHDLEILLDHSGLVRRIQTAPQVQDSFSKIKEVWVMEGFHPIRYKNPGEFSGEIADKFLSWVGDEEVGVAPWVKKQT